MAANRKNPSSSRRRGDRYQDLWGAYFIGQWLQDQSKYIWVQYECIPIDELKSGFHLDDVVLCLADNSFELYQFKHVQNPSEKTWGWDSLVLPEKDAKTSLLRKWSKSLNRPELRGKIRTAVFKTNGVCDLDVATYLEGDSIKWEKLRTADPITAERILAEFDNDVNKAENFFATMHFQFADLELDKLREALNVEFLQKIRITESSLRNLLERLQEEAISAETRRLELKEILDWCEFNKPRPLDENFKVPPDFQLFDVYKHQSFLQMLESGTGGVQVIFGKPGTGKSTYLANLHKVLSAKGHTVVRHHYYLFEGDQSEFERTNLQRVLEALKSQLLNFQKRLGKVSYQDAQRVSVREYLAELSKNYSKDRRCSVVIIDGIDHALRYVSKEQLVALFEDVGYGLPGVWIVLGTQETAKNSLPTRILEKCPFDQWIEIGGLAPNAIEALVIQNETKLRLPTKPELFAKLRDTLTRLCEGNALHLRYCLRTLKEASFSKEVDYLDIEGMPPYGGDIRNYYAKLWHQLPEAGRLGLITIDLAEQVLKENQFSEFLGHVVQYPADITRAIESTRFLLRGSERGLSFYHTSLHNFIREQQEFVHQTNIVIVKMLEWLHASSHEYLKWYLVPMLSAKQASPSDLQNVDRRWLLDALVSPRLHVDILRVLKTCVEVQFVVGDYPAVIKTQILLGYLKECCQASEVLSDLFAESYFACESILLDPVFDDWNAQVILAHVLKARRLGRQQKSLLHLALDALDARHMNVDYAPKSSRWALKPPPVPLAILHLVAMEPDISLKHVYRFLVSMRHLGWSPDFYASLTSNVLRYGQSHRLAQLFKFNLRRDEKQAILLECARGAIEGTCGPDIISRRQTLLSSEAVFLLQAAGITRGIPGTLPRHRDLPRAPHNAFGQSSRLQHSKLFEDIFFDSATHFLRGSTAIPTSWATSADDDWVGSACCALIEAAREFSAKLANGSYSVSCIARAIDACPLLTFNDGHDAHDLQALWRLAVQKIIAAILCVRFAKEPGNLLTAEELCDLVNAKHFGANVVRSFFAERERACIEPTSLKKFIAEQDDSIRHWATNFSERAAAYLELAKLARVHGLVETSAALRTKTAENSIAYGYRKDLLWSEILKAINECQQAGSSKTLTWLQSITSEVEALDIYTDGDETRYIPGELLDIYAAVAPEVLKKKYIDSENAEQFFKAESAFCTLLETMTLSDEIDIAIASTATSAGARKVISERALDDSGFAVIHQQLNQALGAFDPGGARESYYSNHPKGEPKTSDDLTSVSPSQLNAYIDGLSDRWVKKEYLTRWVQHWFQLPSFAITQTVVDILNKFDYGIATDEILDLLYPRVVNADPDLCFELLCKAHAIGNGWSPYWQSQAVADKRISFLQTHFPSRFREFFSKSSFYASRFWAQDTPIAFPLVRGVKFFIRFGALELCERVVHSVIDSAKGLMADLELPAAPWCTTVADKFDVLTVRLVAPSPVCRERAAVAIARLLLLPHYGRACFDKLLDWIHAQLIEPRALCGLLAIVRASSINAKELSRLPLTRLGNSLSIDSLRLSAMLKVINNACKISVSLQNSVATNFATLQPAAKVPEKAKLYVPLLHMLGKQLGTNFQTLWFGRVQALLDVMRVPDHMGAFQRFRNIGADEICMYWMRSQAADLFEHAFIESIEILGRRGLLPADAVETFALKSVPIDINIWDVQPAMKPEWWPSVVSHKASPVEVSPIVEELLEPKNGERILGIRGKLSKKQHQSSDGISISIKARAFAYRSDGPAIPSPKQIMDTLSECYLPTELTPGILKNVCKFAHSPEKSIGILDLQIWPLVCTVRVLSNQDWLWYRGFETILLPAARLKQISYRDFGLTFHLEDGVDSQFFDWVDLSDDRAVPRFDFDNGSWLSAPEKYIQEVLTSLKMRIAYVYENRTCQRDNTYSEPRVNTEYGLLGLSSLIL